ncbi:MAG: hypothetical protein RLZZ598_590 [Pseudomonadota bacterium]
MVVTRAFLGRRPETEEAMAEVSGESQAALRQFSLERMLGYGVDYADAVELRARVLTGQDWCAAATELAEICLQQADNASPDRGCAMRAACWRRASALLRLSQALMLSDTDARRAIFAKAVSLYAQAAELLADRQHVHIDTPLGTLAGWLFPSRRAALGSVVVVGGIEGWGMDFESLGDALADQGIDALMLDAPGQGETRFAHRVYLSANWRDAYRAAIDYLDARAPGRPIGIVGNSMGGSFAMAVAADDVRIRACCNNGGVIAPSMVPPVGTFFTKMTVCCDLAAERAVEVWRTVTPVHCGANQGYPLLIVQGGKDPMVSTPMSQMLLEHAPTDDKQMVIFSDGDHCIYNHKADRDILIAGWMSARLAGLTSHVIAHSNGVAS